MASNLEKRFLVIYCYFLIILGISGFGGEGMIGRGNNVIFVIYLPIVLLAIFWTIYDFVLGTILRNFLSKLKTMFQRCFTRRKMNSSPSFVNFVFSKASVLYPAFLGTISSLLLLTDYFSTVFKSEYTILVKVSLSFMFLFLGLMFGFCASISFSPLLSGISGYINGSPLTDGDEVVILVGEHKGDCGVFTGDFSFSEYISVVLCKTGKKLIIHSYEVYRKTSTINQRRGDNCENQQIPKEANILIVKP